jgi:hypothetical protein
MLYPLVFPCTKTLKPNINVFGIEKQTLLKAVLVFLVLEEGRDPLTHHQPKQNAKDCFLASASPMGCRIVVAHSSISKCALTLDTLPDILEFLLQKTSRTL